MKWQKSIFYAQRRVSNTQFGAIPLVPVESNNTVFMATNAESYVQRVLRDVLTWLLFYLIEFWSLLKIIWQWFLVQNLLWFKVNGRMNKIVAATQKVKRYSRNLIIPISTQSCGVSKRKKSVEVFESETDPRQLGIKYFRKALYPRYLTGFLISFKQLEKSHKHL